MEKIKWPTTPAIMVSVALCFNKKKELLLVLQKDRDYWSPPSGEIERNETPEEAAIRETKEEIDLSIKVVRSLKPVVRWQNEYQNAVLILFHFLCEIEEGKIKHMKTSEYDYDVIKHKWASLEDISHNRYNIAQNVPLLLEEIKENLKHFENGRFTKK